MTLNFLIKLNRRMANLAYVFIQPFSLFDVDPFSQALFMNILGASCTFARGNEKRASINLQADPTISYLRTFLPQIPDGIVNSIGFLHLIISYWVLFSSNCYKTLIKKCLYSKSRIKVKASLKDEGMWIFQPP